VLVEEGLALMLRCRGVFWCVDSCCQDVVLGKLKGGVCCFLAAGTGIGNQNRRIPVEDLNWVMNKDRDCLI